MRHSLFHTLRARFGIIWLVIACMCAGLLFSRPAAARESALIPANSPATLPTTYQDVGAVRVWADQFASANGVTTATGNVTIGLAITNQPYYIFGDSLSWPTGVGNKAMALPMNGKGVLKTVAGLLDLGKGPFAINPDTGALSWEPGSQVLYKTIGSSSLSITPTLTVNVLQPTVNVKANLALKLPEQDLNTAVDFTIDQTGHVTASGTSNIALKVAGGSLTGQVTVNDQGLFAPQVNYALPDIGTVSLQNLVIDGKGPLKMHFGAAATFPIPNLNLGNGVFVLSNLQATLSLTTTANAATPSYAIQMGGTVTLNLPKNSGLQVQSLALGIADGAVYGTIKNLSLNVAGMTLTMPTLGFRRQVFAARANSPQAARYELVAGTGSWSVPMPWQGVGTTAITLKDVVVMTQAPYIQVGAAGAGFTANQTYYLGGSPTTATSVSFANLSGKFVYDAAQSAWNAQLSTNVSFKFGQDTATTINGVQLVVNNGFVSGSLANVNLKVAGLNLNATNLAYNNDKFTAASVTIALPAAWGAAATATATDLAITKSGFTLGGAGASFTSAQTYYLGGSAGSSASASFANLSGSFTFAGSPTNKWTVTLSANVAIKLGNDTMTTLNGVQLTIMDGSVSASLANVTLKAAGLNLRADNLAYNNDKFTAASVTITLPWAWAKEPLGIATATASNLEIARNSFKIGAAGAGFTSNKTYYLGGSATSAASVSFANLGGKFVYNAAQSAWEGQLSANVSFKFGNDAATTVNGVTLKISNGVASASIASVNLKMAGLNLKATNLAYVNDKFTAGSVTLTLPQSWGGISASVTGLEITKNGLKIGGAGGSFNLPSVNLGILQMTGMVGSVKFDQGGNYTIGIAATVTISKVTTTGGANGVSATGSLRIKNGQVDGTINSFSFKMVGLEFQVTNASFVNKVMTAQQVKLKLPPSLGSATTTIYGLEIGGDKGFSIAGGSFKLPNFSMAGVGIENAQAEFKNEGGVYTIAAGAKINLKAMSIEGRFKLAYNSNNGQVMLKQVYLAFEGQIPTTAIPLGSTGFYITKIWGQFDMDTNLLKLSFGVTADTALKIGGTSLLGIDGSVSIQVKPSFAFETTANGRLLGYEIASVNLKITSTSFALKAELDAIIVQASVEIAFGKDAANEFTFYGKAKISFKIKKGALVDCCWIITIPPFDVNLGSLTFDGGKFWHKGKKVWGARYSSSIFGLDFYVFARFKPSLGLDVGTSMDAYKPIKPVLKPDELARLQPDAKVLDVTITQPSTTLSFIEGITVPNRLAPQDLQIVGPQDVSFTQTVAYQSDDKSQRVINVEVSDPAQAVGTWRVISKEGNEVMVMGGVSGPTVNTFAACSTETGCLANTSGISRAVTLHPGNRLDLQWKTSHVTEGLALEVYAEDQLGQRTFLADQYVQTGSELTGSATWSTFQSGTYTVTLKTYDEFGRTTVVSKVPVVIKDTMAPSAPIGLQAAQRADGSAALSWNAAKEPDIKGYQISVDGTEPIVVERPINAYDLFGLDITVPHTVTVAAYDVNDLLGPASTTTVTLNSLSVTSAWPTRGMSASMVNHATVAFNKPVIVDSFTIANAAGLLSGYTTPITSALDMDTSLTIGALWKAPASFLKPGDYTATVKVRDAQSDELLEVTWPFTVVDAPNKLYLPSIFQR